MSVQKDHGGICFRNLQAFNLAMLGKQGWRIISSSDALVSKLLKAKYFPRGDFINAKLGYNPSFTWRSIWNSRIILQKGCRWRIGCGHNVNVWNDPWLRDICNFLINTPPISDCEFMKVSDLMIPGRKEWDYELLMELFNERDVYEISNIPLSVGAFKDVWV